MNLGTVLRSWRHHEELTIREAAARLGLTHPTYSRIERGWPVDGTTLATVLRWLLMTE